MNSVECWKPIPFLPDFEVSNLGGIRNTKTGNIRSTPTGKRGYSIFSTKINGKIKLITVHRCVASAFLENPKLLPQVNHIGGNKTNNNVSNLEWVSAKDNSIHARKTGLHTKDGDKAVIQIKGNSVVAVYKSASEASRITGINRGDICNVCRNYVSKNGKHYLTAGGYSWKWKTI